MGVLVLGIDGLGFGGLKRLSDMGYLRSVDFLARRFSRAIAKTCFPPQTVPAWISIFTGVNPGKHGLFSFFSTSRGAIRVNTSLDVKFPYVFEILSMLRKSVVLINVPLSYPFKILYGVAISDWLAPHRVVMVRHEKKNLISDIATRSLFLNPALRGILGWHRFAELLVRELEIRRWLIEGLLELEFLENYFIVISDVDWLMHSFYHLMINGRIPKFVHNVLRKVDKLIDSIIRKALKRDMDIVVVSDHGFRVYNKIVFVNTILKKLGLVRGLSIRKISSQRKAKVGLKSLLGGEKRNVAKGFAEKIFSSLQRIPLSPEIHRRIYKSIMRGNIRLFVDTERSLVFSLLNVPAFFIKVNRKVRNKDAYINYTVRALSRIKDRYGRKIFGLVARREELYWGPYVRYAPHIGFFGNIKAKYITSAILMGTTILSKVTNYHDFDAIFIAKSEDIPTGRLGIISIYDIAPTLYTLLGVSPQKGIDGKSLANKDVGTRDYTMRWSIASRIATKKIIL